MTLLCPEAKIFQTDAIFIGLNKIKIDEQTAFG
jgi:hypothetical protein